MRHAIAGNKLGRNSGLRKATVRDLAKATLIRQRIRTTEAKAKEARKLVDRLITLGKKGELAHRRRAFAVLGNHKEVSQLFQKTAPRFQKRQGGYTRIIPLARRRGDNAQWVYLELTEKEKVIISKVKKASSKIPAETKVEKIQGKIPEEKKPDPQKSQKAKPFVKKPEESPDQGKLGKKFMGGIKQMFRRKTGP